MWINGTEIANKLAKEKEKFRLTKINSLQKIPKVAVKSGIDETVLVEWQNRVAL